MKTVAWRVSDEYRVQINRSEYRIGGGVYRACGGQLGTLNNEGLIARLEVGGHGHDFLIEELLELFLGQDVLEVYTRKKAQKTSQNHPIIMAITLRTVKRRACVIPLTIELEVVRIDGSSLGFVFWVML